MKESDFLSVENDPEFNRILSIYQEMQRTGKAAYLEDYELADLADYYDENGDDENLKQVIDLFESMHPDSYEIAYARGRFLLRQGKWKEVHANIEKMKEFAHYLHTEGNTDYQNGIISDIYMLKGEMALMHNNPEEADRFFRQAFDVVLPEDDKSYVAIHVASLYLQYEIEEKTIKWIERSIKLIPDNQPALEMLSYYYNDRKDIKKAEKILEKLVDEDPYSTHYWKLAGDIYLNNEQFEKAIDAYDFALAIDTDDSEALKKKAVAFIHLENYEKGIQLLDKYLKKIPNDFNALLLSAICLSSSGQVSAAIELLEHIMEETNFGKDDPTVNQLDLFHLIVRTYRLNKELDKAIKWINKAIKLGMDKSIFHIMKGGIYIEKKMEKKAFQYFKKAIAEAKDQIAILYLISNELFFYGCYEPCQSILLQVYEATEKGEFPSVPSMLAYCYLRLEKYDEYLRFLKEACQETPYDTKIVFSDLIPEEMSPKEFYESERERFS